MRRLTKNSLALSCTLLATIAGTSTASAQAEPFVGQAMLFGGNFCPRGWANADGSILSIASNTALFSLLGTTYGGNGTSTFALPDLRGRAPIFAGTGPGLSTYALGQIGGQESFTLTTAQMPSHSHVVNATNATADQGGPQGRYLGGGVGDDDVYHNGPANRTMAADMIAQTGGSQPVQHRGPYLAMTWCIALEGIYPPRP
ncbi:phage tail protein [Mangrovicella endophytica]|uniref:phage tail protein n=1 Tax=Mangrovicella endophytica TaxID=2066697 RepID=UPI001FDF3BDD|nr:tail fiber protein [Mangrovicella endophytica]